jgi:Fe-S-cluster containining protein
MMTAVEHNPTAHPSSMRSDLIQIGSLPQHVPSRVCLSCDVCCRFPEADSFLRPYFTAHEIAEATSRGINPDAFPDAQGSQIRVVPNPMGEGYVCSAFDAATSHCRIYEKRPLDCQIYPLAVMWSADHRQVVLGWDTKCPFIGTGSGFEVRGSGLKAETETIDQYGAKIAALIQEDKLEIFVRNPRLIGRYQDDIVVLQSLPLLTKRLRKQEDISTFDPRTLNSDPPLSNQSQTSNAEPRTSNQRRTPNLEPRLLKLRPLASEDYPRFQRAFAAVDTPLAAYALAPHVIWGHLFSYYWSECDGYLYLFAEYTDGLFMPLPPLGPGPLEEPLSRAFAFMRNHNHGSAVSRIENVPEEWKAEWEAWGYSFSRKDADYVYDAQALVELRGDRYKSHRAACNRFIRGHGFRYEPYDEGYRAPCLDLYRKWAMQKEAREADSVAQMMLEDSEAAHHAALTMARQLGLIGRIVWTDDGLVAYTFGYFRTPSVFCVLVEIVDRSIAGLAAYLFREFCRDASEQGAIVINTLDDSGLEALRRTKQNYHPVRMIQNYIATTS